MTHPDPVVPWSALLFTPWPALLADGEAAVQTALLLHEEESRRICCYSDCLVPGLLQTPGYARVVLGEAIRRYQAPGGLEEAVNARMARQTTLEDVDRSVHIVVHENALYQQVGESAVMAGQMRRLAELAARPPIALRLGVLPRAAGYQPAVGGGSFDLHENSVYTETAGGLLAITDPAVWDDCRQHHQDLAAESRYGSAAAELLDQARLSWEGT